MKQFNLHIVGLGNLGRSFLNGFEIIKSDINLNLYENNKEVRDSLSKNGWENVYSNIDNIDDGIVLLCIKPNDLIDFVSNNKTKINSKVLICSSLAGVSIQTLESHFENKIIRLMPNLAISKNSGFIPFTRNYKEDYLNFVKTLNNLVLEYAIPQVYGEAKSYMQYKHDVSTLVVPLANPIMSKTNDKQLYLKNFF